MLLKLENVSANFCLLGERKETLFIGQNTNVSNEFAVFVVCCMLNNEQINSEKFD